MGAAVFERKTYSSETRLAILVGTRSGRAKGAHKERALRAAQQARSSAPADAAARTRPTPNSLRPAWSAQPTLTHWTVEVRETLITAKASRPEAPRDGSKDRASPLKISGLAGHGSQTAQLLASLKGPLPDRPWEGQIKEANSKSNHSNFEGSGQRKQNGNLT